MMVTDCSVPLIIAIKNKHLHTLGKPTEDSRLQQMLQGVSANYSSNSLNNKDINVNNHGNKPLAMWAAYHLPVFSRTPFSIHFYNLEQLALPSRQEKAGLTYETRNLWTVWGCRRESGSLPALVLGLRWSGKNIMFWVVDIETRIRMFWLLILKQGLQYFVCWYWNNDLQNFKQFSQKTCSNWFPMQNT